MAARVIFIIIICYFLCLTNVIDSSNNVTSLPSTSNTTHFDVNAPTTTAMKPTAASGTQATSISSVNTNTVSKDTTQSVHALASSNGPTSTGNSVTTTMKPDYTTTTSNNTSNQTAVTTKPGLVTKGNGQQQTTHSMGIPKTTNNTEQVLNRSVASTEAGKSPVAEADSGQQSKDENAPNSSKSDGKYFWLLVLGVAPLAAGMYMVFKWCKVQHLPVENIDHGTENASFQRTESKDGVMLLGVKSGGEENVAAK